MGQWEECIISGSITMMMTARCRAQSLLLLLLLDFPAGDDTSCRICLHLPRLRISLVCSGVWHVNPEDRGEEEGVSFSLFLLHA